jgi:hypothetical protein
MDYDTISAHDAIGKVYIDLTPLVLDDGPKAISGWYPIYDTLHGETFTPSERYTCLYVT